jgi:plasmid stabilization system protein ParE
MRYIVDILPAALSDIIEAAQWYEDQREGLGADFAVEVDKAIDRLEEQALVPRIRYRRKSVRWIHPRRFPYRICYYVEGQTVHVFAVVHDARHDRVWRSRL